MNVGCEEDRGGSRLLLFVAGDISSLYAMMTTHMHLKAEMVGDETDIQTKPQIVTEETGGVP